MSDTKISDDRLRDLAEEYGDMAGKLTGELQDGPGAASAFYMSASLGEVASIASELLSLRTSPPPSGEAGEGVDLADLQLLMHLKDDNVWDGARPVVERDFEQCFRLSEAGLIALEQVALGVRLHITRLGVRAISRALPTIKEPTDEVGTARSA
jgi:hypothetical protein